MQILCLLGMYFDAVVVEFEKCLVICEMMCKMAGVVTYIEPNSNFSDHNVYQGIRF